jgi:hypothetical protein
MRILARRALTRIAAAAAAITLVAVGSVAVASAHSQTVTPPGQDGPTVTGPISKSWAQAHCNSNAPSVVALASGGVVVFSPAAALPCPPVENPGGQIHP